MSSPIRPPLWITETDGNPSGRPINKIIVSNGTLTINGTTATITTGGSGGSGTVTNVSSTDSFISISNPNTTPSITIQDATNSQDGILTSTDWNTFNNKTANAGTVTSVGSSQAFVSVASASTTPSISIGSASGSATGVLTSTDWTTFNNKGSGDGTVTSVGSSQAFVSVASATTTPSISIGSASGSATGVLTSTDWTTFNNKGSGDGTIGGSIANTQVAVGSGTNTIAGGNSLLFDGTSLTVNTGSTDPTLNLTNSSKAVTLKVTTSQKLTIQGSSDTFVFDASSSTGGITFPDGTTQTTAASGGGGGIGGSITDNKIAVGASTADDIEGYTDFTYNDATDTLTVGEKIDSSGTSPLLLVAGSSVISVLDGGVNNHINISPASGRINAQSSTLSVGTGSANTTISSSGANNLTLNTNDGTNSGSIVIADGVDGQISITPNGAGTIKLDGVELDNSAIATGYVLKATSATAAGWAAESGGGVSFPLEGSSGSTSAPTYSFSADTDTGIYLSGASNMGIVAGGVSYINIGGLGIVELTRRLRNTAGTAALPAYSFSGDSDSGFWSSNPDEISLSLGGSRLFDFQKSGTSGKLQFRGSAPIIECDDGGADLSLRSGGSTYAEILIQNENSNIDIKPAGTGKVKISNAYTLPSAVTTANDYVLTAQTDGTTAWAAAGGGSTSPAGSNKELQFNNNGAFGASNRCQLEIFSPSGNAGFGLNDNGAAFTSNGFLIYAQGNVFFQGQVFGNEYLCGSSSSSDVGFGSQVDQDTGIAFSSSDQVDIVTGGSYNISFGSAKEILLEGTNAGTSGQVITSNGAGAKVAWDNPKALSGTPSSSTATGAAGDLQYDADYLYVCIAVNSWKRVGLSAW